MLLVVGGWWLLYKYLPSNTRIQNDDPSHFPLHKIPLTPPSPSLHLPPHNNPHPFITPPPCPSLVPTTKQNITHKHSHYPLLSPHTKKNRDRIISTSLTTFPPQLRILDFRPSLVDPSLIPYDKHCPFIARIAETESYTYRSQSYNIMCGIQYDTQHTTSNLTRSKLYT